MIMWIPPNESWFKLNKDGTCKSNNLAGCGGIIRDHQGKCKGASSNILECAMRLKQNCGVCMKV